MVHLNPSAPFESVRPTRGRAVSHDADFRRVHQTLRVTAAVEAGVANQVWSMEETVGLMG